MGQVEVIANLVDKMAFQMDLDGHKLITDASYEVGGNDLGPRPKKLLLAGLIGCTGIDVVSILKKMKVEPEKFQLEVKAGSSEEHPKVYTNIHLTYRFKGKDLPMDKLERAVQLSQEKYCAVSAMIKKAVPVTYESVVE